LNLEKYFSQFRKEIIGNDKTFLSPFGEKKIIYLDWAASGRLYGPVEEKLLSTFGPYVANTHTESNITGSTMTNCYHEALQIIKEHVNANASDTIITDGSGMTGVMNKFQRILGLKIHENFHFRLSIPEEERPVVFITSMEHHSNHTSWLETICDVEVVPNCTNNVVDLNYLRNRLEFYKNKRKLIGSFSACSNVSGLITPYHKLARLMHEYNGVCFVDFSASAPYVDIDMHPNDPMEKLDAILFSPHKFLGGPGSSGVLIFDSSMYQNKIPDHPGGGTVEWTNPWGEKKYINNIREREDGGTPGFLQTIRTALAIKVKDAMGTMNILNREEELEHIVLDELRSIENVVVLENSINPRLGFYSFYLKDIHHNLVVRLLNDRFGIQVRGGCSCAGTYGHMLLNITREMSKSITDEIDNGNISVKPGWIRMSVHPTTTNEEVVIFTNALKDIIQNIGEWSKDYIYLKEKNDFIYKDEAVMDVGNYFEMGMVVKS